MLARVIYNAFKHFAEEFLFYRRKCTICRGHFVLKTEKNVHITAR